MYGTLNRGGKSGRYDRRMGRRNASRIWRIPWTNGVSRGVSNKTEGLDDIRDAVDAVSDKLGRLSFLWGNPDWMGIEGMPNRRIPRAIVMDISYEGIRLTPDQIIEAARENAPHVIGLSILSGSHLPFVEEVLQNNAMLDWGTFR